MNQERRKHCEELCKKLDDLAQELEGLKDSEVDANDSKPESIQDSTAGDALDNALSNLNECTGFLEEACGG